MASLKQLNDVINQMRRQGDQQPMREAVKLIAHSKLTVADFAASSEEAKVGYLSNTRSR